MAFGLKPSRRNGSTPNSKGLTKYRTANGYSTALFSGDPVTVSNGTIVRAVNGDKLAGVVEAFVYLNAQLGPVWTTYLPASTSSSGLIEGDPRPIAMVDDDPTSTFIIQCQLTAAVSTVDVGKTFGVSIGAGDIYSKNSGAVLGAAITTVAESMVRVVGLYDIPNNAFGVSGNIVEVSFTNHMYK